MIVPPHVDPAKILGGIVHAAFALSGAAGAASQQLDMADATAGSEYARADREVSAIAATRADPSVADVRKTYVPQPALEDEIKSYLTKRTVRQYGRYARRGQDDARGARAE
jgi:hypothetical protein